MNTLVKLIASFGFIGHIPFASGTMACIPLLIGFLLFPSQTGVWVLTAVSTVAGLAVCRAAVRVYRKHDPSMFVMDEVAGYAVTLIALPLTAPVVWAGFFVFRLLDIVKPLGIRRLDRMQVAESIMYDDLLAGIYGNLILRILIVFFPQWMLG